MGSSIITVHGKWLLTQDLFQIVVADPPSAMEVEEVKKLLEQHQKPAEKQQFTGDQCLILLNIQQY